MKDNIVRVQDILRAELVSPKADIWIRNNNFQTLAAGSIPLVQ